jgi:hypothetical protein
LHRFPECGQIAGKLADAVAYANLPDFHGNESAIHGCFAFMLLWVKSDAVGLKVRGWQASPQNPLRTL